MLEYEFAKNNFKIKNFNVKEGFILFKDEKNEIIAVSSGWTHWDGDTPKALCIYPLRDDGIYMDENNISRMDWYWEDDGVYPVWEIFQLPDWQIDEDDGERDFDKFTAELLNYECADEEDYPKNVYEYMKEKQEKYTGKTNQYHYITNGKNTANYDFGGRILDYNELGIIFNFDGFNLPLDEKRKSFIDSVGNKFVEIPSELLSYTTSQNFDCYIAKI